MNRRSYDVIIIGGGAIGVCTAYHLSRSSDLRVALFEANQIGGGSTGLSAGGIRQQLFHEREVQLAIDAVDQFQRFNQESDQFTFEQNGYLVLARTAQEADQLQDHARMQRGVGLEVEGISMDAVQSRAPYLTLDDITAANYCSTDGVVDPNLFTNWAAERAKEQGVKIHQHSPVTDIKTQNGSVRGVNVGEDRYNAKNILIAGGVWSNKLISYVGDSLPLEPTRIQIGVVRGDTALSGTEPFVMDYSDKVLYRPTNNDSLMVCGQGDQSAVDNLSDYKKSHDRSFEKQVVDYLDRKCAGFNNPTVTNGWAGLKAITPDSLPLIGEHQNYYGLYVAAGFNGHGFMVAPAVGRELSKKITSGDWGTVNLNPFSPYRFAGR